jgi:hypothetical protein
MFTSLFPLARLGQLPMPLVSANPYAAESRLIWSSYQIAQRMPLSRIFSRPALLGLDYMILSWSKRTRGSPLPNSPRIEIGMAAKEARGRKIVWP